MPNRFSHTIGNMPHHCQQTWQACLPHLKQRCTVLAPNINEGVHRAVDKLPLGDGGRADVPDIKVLWCQFRTSGQTDTMPVCFDT